MMTDRQSILAACEDRLGDRTQLLVAADWFAENGEPDMETACRWMAEFDKHPLPPTPVVFVVNGEPYWLWTCYGGLCGPRFNCGVAHTLPRALCKRIGFMEWYCRRSYTGAVEVLAAALAQGWVECRGNPAEVDEETLEDIRLQGEELRRTLAERGVPNE